MYKRIIRLPLKTIVSYGGPARQVRVPYSGNDFPPPSAMTSCFLMNSDACCISLPYSVKNAWPCKSEGNLKVNPSL